MTFVAVASLTRLRVLVLRARDAVLGWTPTCFATSFSVIATHGSLPIVGGYAIDCIEPSRRPPLSGLTASETQHLYCNRLLWDMTPAVASPAPECGGRPGRGAKRRVD